MEFGFLFWLFLIGIGLASLQDLKRREVDNWLNLLLLFSGGIYLIFLSVINNDKSVITLGVISFLAMFLLANLFYYGRIFAGGDAKLLFAMFALFVASSYYDTLFNIGAFVFFLLLSGSAYGLIYSVVLAGIRFKEVKKEVKREFENVYLKYSILAGIVFFVLSYVELFFMLLAFVFFLVPVLFVFSKALEKAVMVKFVAGKNLREGDWLAEDLTIGKKVFKANWEGLTKQDLKLLKRKSKVKIKEGLPFVPAFFIAFLLWTFKDYFIELIIKLF